MEPNLVIKPPPRPIPWRTIAFTVAWLVLAGGWYADHERLKDLERYAGATSDSEFRHYLDSNRGVAELGLKLSRLDDRLRELEHIHHAKDKDTHDE